MDTTTGPRRYRVNFDCSDTDVASIIGLLVRDVEMPKMEPAGTGMFKMSMICMFDQIPMITDLVVKNVKSADNLVVARYVEVTPIAMQRYAHKPELNTTALGAQAVPINRYPMKQSRIKGGAKASETNTGRAIMALFKTKSIIHNPDAIDALENAGLAGAGVGNALSRLTQEGALVRCGYGAYRRPTATEEIEFLAQKQARVGASPKSTD